MCVACVTYCNAMQCNENIEHALVDFLGACIAMQCNAVQRNAMQCDVM